MTTNVLFVRSATTAWSYQRRLVGRRDLGLDDRGQAQAADLANALAPLQISEIVTSPLARALQTAEAIGRSAGIEVARDPRLTALDVGRWEGEELDGLLERDAFEPLLTERAERFPDGEPFDRIRDRLTASIEQALDDNPTAANIVLVSHSVPIRLALSRYLGLSSTAFRRLQVAPASCSILSFDDHASRATLTALNWRPGVPSPIEPSAEP